MYYPTKLSTFQHNVFGWFVLNRKVAREYNTEQLFAAAELLFQVGH